MNARASGRVLTVELRADRGRGTGRRGARIAQTVSQMTVKYRPVNLVLAAEVLDTL